jgi:uncharacterized surface anchored protein
MGRIIKINNVRNDYSVSIPMDVSQNSEGKLNYFGLTTSTNAYFTHDSGNSITNAGSLTGPNTLVGPGLQNPVKLPIPSSTITIDGQTYYFNYYVVQVVTEKVISPINEVQGNNYALQPLDTLPANANFAWAYYSDSPGAIIHYKTEDGTELLTSPTLIGESGDTIPSEVRDFTGYTLVSVPEEDSFKKAQLTNLTYVYRKNPVAATVTVKYIDTQGNSISDYIPLSGNVGQEYTTEQKIISGYTFKEVQGNKSGLLSTTPQTVTYIYTKNPIEIKTGTVTIKYVDTNGNSISDEITKSGNVGSLYTSEQKKILGYNFKEIQGIEEGQFTIESQTVTYVYTKISTPTIIKTSVIPPKTLSVKTLPKESLPETGDKFFGFTLLSGSLLILVSTTLYLLKSKNINNKKEKLLVTSFFYFV